MWGSSIVGYGQMTYEGRNGRAVDWFPVGFSPRKAALVLYLMGGLKANANLLAELGPTRSAADVSISLASRQSTPKSWRASSR
jgi:hypothetical protein